MKYLKWSFVSIWLLINPPPNKIHLCGQINIELNGNLWVQLTTSYNKQTDTLFCFKLKTFIYINFQFLLWLDIQWAYDICIPRTLLEKKGSLAVPQVEPLKVLYKWF